MKSLKELVYDKIFIVLMEGRNLFLGKCLPNELYEEYIIRLQGELRVTKIENLKFKERVCKTNEEKLELVEDAHKDGLCQTRFRGKCHVCRDEFCVLCWHPNAYSCAECFHGTNVCDCTPRFHLPRAIYPNNVRTTAYY